VLVNALLDELGPLLKARSSIVELGEVGPYVVGATPGAPLRHEAAPAIATIEQADLLIVASPVVRASYLPLLKHLFTFVDPPSLEGMPLVLADCGGTHRSRLLIGQELAPWIEERRLRRLDADVYASDEDFACYEFAGVSLPERIRAAAREICARMCGTPHRGWEPHAVPVELKRVQTRAR
jgi:FMN reductase